jgi:hypothetical protein
MSFPSGVNHSGTLSGVNLTSSIHGWLVLLIHERVPYLPVDATAQPWKSVNEGRQWIAVPAKCRKEICLNGGVHPNTV